MDAGVILENIKDIKSLISKFTKGNNEAVDALNCMANAINRIEKSIEDLSAQEARAQKITNLLKVIELTSSLDTLRSIAVKALREKDIFSIRSDLIGIEGQCDLIKEAANDICFKKDMSLDALREATLIIISSLI